MIKKMSEKGARKSVEELYKGCFAIREALQDATQLAAEAAVIADAFGGEIARVITEQLNSFFIPAISKYIDNEDQPGAIAPLITFLDSVPLAMTRQEAEPIQTTPAPVAPAVAAEIVAPPGTPAEGSFAAKQESRKREGKYGVFLRRKTKYGRRGSGIPQKTFDSLEAAKEWAAKQNIWHEEPWDAPNTQDLDPGVVANARHYHSMKYEVRKLPEQESRASIDPSMREGFSRKRESDIDNEPGIDALKKVFLKGHVQEDEVVQRLCAAGWSTQAAYTAISNWKHNAKKESRKREGYDDEERAEWDSQVAADDKATGDDYDWATAKANEWEQENNPLQFEESRSVEPHVEQAYMDGEFSREDAIEALYDNGWNREDAAVEVDSWEQPSAFDNWIETDEDDEWDLDSAVNTSIEESTRHVPPVKALKRECADTWGVYRTTASKKGDQLVNTFPTEAEAKRSAKQLETTITVGENLATGLAYVARKVSMPAAKDGKSQAAYKSPKALG